MGDYNRYRYRPLHATWAPNTLTHAFPVSCANRTEKPIAYYYGVPWGSGGQYTYDCVTPGFHRLKKARKAGNLPVNPFFSWKTDSQLNGYTSFTSTSVADACTGPSIKEWFRNEGAFLVGNVWSLSRPNHLVNHVDSEIVRLQAEIRTAALAQRQQGNTNLTESIAEVDKSFSMIRHPLENVAHFIRDFRRSAKRRRGYERVAADSFGFIRFASAEWLRFRYGISPLISDVKSVMKALKKDYEPAPRPYSTRKVGNWEKSDFVLGNFTAGGNTYKVNYRITGRASYTVRVQWKDWYVASPWTDLGLTFHNVVGVAWELTHYSFVVDWFANVGDLIYANIPRVGITKSESYMIEKWEQYTSLTPDGLVNIAPTVRTLSGSVSDSCTISDIILKRSIPPSGPELVIKHDFRFDHWIRATDAAALVMQRLRSIGF